MTGKVHSKAVNGFGFIEPDDGSSRRFFHAKNTNGTFDMIKPGDTVQFEPADGDRGPIALDVRLISTE